MAASAPVPINLKAWKSETVNIDKHMELVMAGMSLVSSLPPVPGRKGSAPIVNLPLHGTQNDENPNSILSSGDDSSPDSVSFEKKNYPSTAKNQSRPPGLNTMALPSPISKPGHSKDSSSSSPLLTLTPNSSVDGNGEWLGLVRQSSPFHSGDGPSMPFLNNDSRRTPPYELVSNFNTLDLSDSHNDGLLGLDALRERAKSVAGTALHSSSPPVSALHSISPPGSLKGYFPSVNTSQPTDFERPRSSRDRPPLSQSYGETSLPSNDRNTGAVGHTFSVPGRNVSDVSNSMNTSDQANYETRGFGAISRPELRQSALEYEPNRIRSSSQDNFQNPFQQQGIPEQAPSKFRALPSPSLQMNQHRRLSESYADAQRGRHVRSASQPGLGMPNMAGNQYFSPGHDAHFYPSPSHSYSDQPSSKNARNMNVPSQLSSSYDGINYSKPTGVGYQPFMAPQRREAYDHQLNAPIQSNEADLHSYSGSSSAGLMPYYGGHHRQFSEGALHSSPNVGLGLGPGHVHSSSFDHHSGLDDDLAGEYIDVPDHDDHTSPLFSETMFMNQANSHPLLRSATHTHSMSLDALPSHYMDMTQFHTNSMSALPQPKVVYAVKFKRSQRNFIPGPRLSRDLKIGTYVKVEADRGEDLGIVVGKVAAEKYNFATRANFSAGIGAPGSLAAGTADLKRIIRLATHDEVNLLSLKREEEEELLRICRRKVRERCLPMNVVDAEYQFDRHKLTFFFEAEGRIDFRELVRDLFSMYKTRIWMQQLDKNTATSANAITFPQTANMQMDYGTPIIAPPSEFADSIILSGLAGFDSRSN